MLKWSEVDRIIVNALKEDVGHGDISTEITIPEATQARCEMNTRESCVVCGITVAKRVFTVMDESISVTAYVKDGERVQAPKVLLSAAGNAHSILKAERVALNLTQLMSGVATHTSRFVAAIEGTNATLLDTRKTYPGLREIQKYAVKMGGGQNHRFRLDDGILIKDNHIAVCGGITAAFKRAKEYNPPFKIEVECDSLEQVREALDAGVDMIMLDNMSVEMMEEAVQYINNRIPIEASGNVTLEKIGAIAKTGVDYISVGELTRAPMIDIGLDTEMQC